METTLSLRGGGPTEINNKDNQNPSELPQVGGASAPNTALAVPQVGGDIDTRPALPSGPNKLTRLFDAMDAVADATQVERVIKALARALGHADPSQLVTDAIYAVLLRAVNPQNYRTDERARAGRKVKTFLFNAWRFRLHTLSHSIPVAACQIAKVIFISMHHFEVRVWVGNRRKAPEDELTLDIPGGDQSRDDVNARATAWRNVAERDMILAPFTRSRLARTLSCTNPVLITQIHPTSKLSTRITIWTQLVRLRERRHVLPSDDGCRKWSHSGWIPAPILIESIKRQGMHEYASGCEHAIDSSLRCHETLPRSEDRAGFLS